MVQSFCPLSGSHQSHATFFSSLTTSVTIHIAIYCQYVLASGVSLALSPFGCHKPAVSSLLTCILVTCVHLSLMQTVTCLTIVSHFTLHLFASSCILSYLLINTLLAAYFPCSHLIAIVPQCLLCSITVFFCTCVLFVLCTLLASRMLVQPCTLIVPCILIAYFHSMYPCDPFHTGHFILTSRFCFLVAVCTLPTLGTLPFAHGPPCSMHLLTICNTILMWGILVAHLTPLAHRCSLHYIQSQFSLTHHFIPNYLLFPDTHSLLYMPFFTYVHLSLCSNFLFCVHFQPYAHSLPHFCSSPHSCSLLLHSD